jgi:Ser/Thr protein kinase RdoA (MazF antagonist)
MLSLPRLDPLASAAAFGFSNATVCGAFVGFSGATVWQIASNSSLFALKAYPPAWNDAQHLAEIHQKVTQASAMLMPQPQATRNGVTIVESQGRLWDMMDWRKGTPAEDIGSALDAVAQLHVIWRRPILAEQRCATVARQWSVLDAWEGSAKPFIICADWRRDASLLTRLIGPARDALRPWLSRPVPVQTVHGDLWTGNVLMNASHVTGIIDCAAVRVDSSQRMSYRTAAPSR